MSAGHRLGPRCAARDSSNLLRFAENTLAKEGYVRLGVDYESFNPSALYFYPKYFSVYTNSLVRRIDERGNR